MTYYTWPPAPRMPLGDLAELAGFPSLGEPYDEAVAGRGLVTGPDAALLDAEASVWAVRDPRRASAALGRLVAGRRQALVSAQGNRAHETRAVALLDAAIAELAAIADADAGTVPGTWAELLASAADAAGVANLAAGIVQDAADLAGADHPRDWGHAVEVLAHLRGEAGIRAINWAKFEAVAGQMTRNAVAQQGLLKLYERARNHGAVEPAAAFARAYQEVGHLTGELRELREKQRKQWDERTKQAAAEAEARLRAGAGGGEEAEAAGVEGCDGCEGLSGFLDDMGATLGGAVQGAIGTVGGAAASLAGRAQGALDNPVTQGAAALLGGDAPGFLGGAAAAIGGAAAGGAPPVVPAGSYESAHEVSMRDVARSEVIGASGAPASTARRPAMRSVSLAASRKAITQPPRPRPSAPAAGDDGGAPPAGPGPRAAGGRPAWVVPVALGAGVLAVGGAAYVLIRRRSQVSGVEDDAEDCGCNG